MHLAEFADFAYSVVNTYGASHVIFLVSFYVASTIISINLMVAVFVEVFNGVRGDLRQQQQKRERGLPSFGPALSSPSGATVNRTASASSAVNLASVFPRDASGTSGPSIDSKLTRVRSLSRATGAGSRAARAQHSYDDEDFRDVEVMKLEGTLARSGPRWSQRCVPCVPDGRMQCHRQAVTVGTSPPACALQICRAGPPP
jgi:hypothetical protein